MWQKENPTNKKLLEPLPHIRASIDLSFILQGRRICSESSVGLAWKQTGRSENWEIRTTFYIVRNKDRTSIKSYDTKSQEQKESA